MESLETIYYVVNIEDDATGLLRTSIVPKPAIGEDFELFDKVYIENFEKNDEERIITGPLMIPDKKILRKFKDGSGYYNCVFTKESILNTVKKASKYNVFNELNLNHIQGAEGKITGVYLIESMILNDRNKSELFSDLPNGTWIASFWVQDEEYWNTVIKSGEFKGFSVEIASEHWTEEEIKQDMLSRVDSILDDPTIPDEKKKEMILGMFPD